jgi:hypothetical protein
MKYAIKVKWPDGGWLYVTEGPANDLRVKVYSSSDAAEEIAESWRLTGKEENVKVVVYKETESDDETN